MAEPPATVWNYCSGLTFLIKEILDRTVGTSADHFIDTRLFLKMESKRQHGFPILNDHVLPRDMAKFGFVFLNGGLWNETRIFSEDWIRLSTVRNFSSPLAEPIRRRVRPCLVDQVTESRL